MYAVSNLGDALDVTRQFLADLHKRSVVVLALVVLFAAGLGVGVPSVPVGDLAELETALTDAGIEADLPTLELLVLLGLAGFGVYLLWTFVGSLAEFVYVSALRSGTVRVGSSVSAHLHLGVSLFAFRAALTLGTLAITAAVAYPLITQYDSLGDVSASTLALLSLFGLVTGLGFAIVSRLTTEFVVPIMLLEDRRVLSAWRRFWPTIRANSGEYVVYLILATVASFVGSIIVGILVGLAVFLLAIPVIAFAFFAFFLGPVGLVLLILLVVVLIPLVIVLYAIVELPFVTYIRYYALLVLGDIDEDLDLIPDRRNAVREARAWGARGEGDSGGSTDGRQAGTDRDGSASDGDRSSDRDRDGWR